MARVVVEILDEHGLRHTYKSFDGPVICLGRGYDNDIILDDPYVSAQHIVIHLESQGWLIEDLNSMNGTWLKPKERVVGLRPIKSNDEITIGKTRLRIMDAAQAVPEPLSLVPVSQFWEDFGHPRKAWLITLCMLTIYALDQHLESYQDLSGGRFIFSAFGLLGIVLVIAGFWAFIGRLIKHRSYFYAQLTLIAVFFIMMQIFHPAGAYLGFITNSPLVESIYFCLIFSFFSFMMLVWSMGIATRLSLSTRRLISAILVAAFFTFGISSQWAARPEFDPVPHYYGVMKPPYIKWAASRPIDQYIAQSAEVFNVEKGNVWNNVLFDLSKNRR